MIRKSRVAVIVAAIVLVLVLCAVLATKARGQTPQQIDFIAMPAAFTDAPAGGPQGGQAELDRADALWNEYSYGRWNVRTRLAPTFQLSIPKPKTCDYTSWNSKVLNAAQALGFYGIPMYFGPGFSTCNGAPGTYDQSNAAQAQCGYGVIWFNGQDTDEIIGHEKGHHFGICPHAARVAALYPPEHFSLQGAYAQPRGHHYSIMAGGRGHPHFNEKVTLGLVDRNAQSVIVQRGQPPTVVTLKPIEQPNGILNAIVYRQDGVPWQIEFRTPTGTDVCCTTQPAFAAHVSVQGYVSWECDLEPGPFGHMYLDDFEGGVKIEYVSASMTEGQIRITTYPVAAIPEPTAPPFATPRPATTVTPDADCWVLKPYIRCSPTPAATQTPTATPSPGLTVIYVPPLPVPTDTPAPGPPTPSPEPTETPAIVESPLPVASPTPTRKPPPLTPIPGKPPKHCPGFGLFGIVLIAGPLAAWRKRLRRGARAQRSRV